MRQNAGYGSTSSAAEPMAKAENIFLWEGQIFDYVILEKNWGEKSLGEIDK